jgi:hypothetical protein
LWNFQAAEDEDDEDDEDEVLAAGFDSDLVSVFVSDLVSVLVDEPDDEPGLDDERESVR